MASSELEAKAAEPSGKFQETDGGRQRFLLELEFLQCLANPTYINYIAQNRLFDDPAFVNYLDYLQYWRRPEYAKFIVYPHCLYFLELLQSSHFRSAIANTMNKELAHRQQFYFWQHHRVNCLKHLSPDEAATPGGPVTDATSAPAALPQPPAATSAPAAATTSAPVVKAAAAPRRGATGPGTNSKRRKHA